MKSIFTAVCIFIAAIFLANFIETAKTPIGSLTAIIALKLVLEALCAVIWMSLAIDSFTKNESK